MFSDLLRMITGYPVSLKEIKREEGVIILKTSKYHTLTLTGLQVMNKNEIREFKIRINGETKEARKTRAANERIKKRLAKSKANIYRIVRAKEIAELLKQGKLIKTHEERMALNTIVSRIGKAALRNNFEKQIAEGIKVDINGYNPEHHHHRVNVLRVNARATFVAYAFLRLKQYDEVEHMARWKRQINDTPPPNWSTVRDIVWDNSAEVRSRLSYPTNDLGVAKTNLLIEIHKWAGYEEKADLVKKEPSKSETNNSSPAKTEADKAA